MPKKPHIFKTEKTAIEKLSAFNSSFKIKLNNEDKATIIEKSVTSNIFRALSLNSERPSEIYRKWANRYFEQIIKTFSKTKTQKGYDKFIFKYSEKLILEWKNNSVEANEKIGFGPAVKIVNLLIKRIQESSQYRQVRLQKFMHVPFDLYSLLPLKEIINEITNLDYKISIPKNVSMSYVTTKQLYYILHEVISKLCRKAKIDRIVYDYWAWNKTHHN